MIRRWILSLAFFFLLLNPGPAVPASVQPLRYAGATTLQKFFMPQAAQLFEARHEGVRFKISGGNTDPGLVALLAGTIDLAGAGRFLEPGEKSAGLRETLIGWDALVVVVNLDNPVENLSREQLRGLFSGRITNWAEVGGRDEPVLVIASPQGSGMHSAVLESVLQGASPTPHALVAGIVAETDRQVSFFPGAICAVSSSMVDAPRTKILKVDGIFPSAENVRRDLYPLKKPLLLVTRNDPGEMVARFVEFSLGSECQNIIGSKFFPAKGD